MSHPVDPRPTTGAPGTEPARGSTPDALAHIPDGNGMAILALCVAGLLGVGFPLYQEHPVLQWILFSLSTLLGLLAVRRALQLPRGQHGRRLVMSVAAVLISLFMLCFTVWLEFYVIRGGNPIPGLEQFVTVPGQA
ncbi:hypothetical protein JIM95_001500 [Corynebacterium sp. CCM 8835]|uniref:Uncharacterized protein n=1 Tax=Corynebacterium antarcticum TaxID=2800405 RepID=A0A9Q4CAP9_9CORY|nr:hypothetical protein [Corynebacterium antarcticum]MCK7641600.1 hypothetical protein [Corynebacterium antarcticum]MCK7660302.1 hypothetical protein [Corynebacterium antarcticum]MCL0244828.1 hypothetical protein [Corynebacterium antarcticum]MCX7491201.1 hypothetical protein [Corynebacterium antarcticum]MCX7537226.1 hypothetical protein [Corynebacterium antarcticum]